MTTVDLTHLDAIRLRKSIHQAELARATSQRQIDWSLHQIKLIEREEKGELEFLAKRGYVETALEDISDDELLALLDA